MNPVMLMMPIVAIIIGFMIKDIPEVQKFMSENISTFIWIIAILVIVSFVLLIMRQFMIKEISLK